MSRRKLVIASFYLFCAAYFSDVCLNLARLFSSSSYSFSMNVRYPHCLYFLELLQNANFRNAMAHPNNKVNSSISVFTLQLNHTFSLISCEIAPVRSYTTTMLYSFLGLSLFDVCRRLYNFSCI